MAFVDGTGENGLAVLVDSRTKNCQEVDGCLPYWGLGNRALGKKEWKRTLRIALRDVGEEPWHMARVREEKPLIEEILIKANIKAVILVQSPATPFVRHVHSAWNMFGRGGSPYKWAGTVWQEDGLYRAPILNPVNYEYVYDWLLCRWVKQAHAVASGKLAPMPWPEASIHADARALEILARIAEHKNAPVAVDIESNVAGTLITAIGFSNQYGTVSVPWDRYNIAGTFGDIEMGIEDYGDIGLEIKSSCINLLQSAQPKVLHNGAYDTFELAKRGIIVGNFEHDTLLMHRVVYPQYRHGLQMACATDLCIEPWKCFFKPPKVGAEEDKWLGCPIDLRTYNCRDAYATYQLYKALEGKLG